MLEKNKDYVEFALRTMMVTHKPYQDHADVGITGIIPDCEIFAANNPLDIPCDVVMVPKKDFDRLQEDNQHYRELAKQWEENYNLLLQKTGFETVEGLIYYLNDIHQCDTLQLALANYGNTIGALRDDISGRSTVIEHYKRDIEKWQKATGCATPAAAKTLIESGMSYEYAYHEEQKKTRKLADDVKSWKNVTGYSTPEDYMHARLNNTTPFDYTAAWLKATGCSTPEEVKSRIEGLENAIRLTNKNMLSEIESNIDEWQKATGCVSPEKALYKITDLYNRIDKMKEAASIASNWTDKIVEG